MAFKVQIHFESANDKHKKGRFQRPFMIKITNYFFSAFFSVSAPQVLADAAQLFFCASEQPVVAVFSAVPDFAEQHAEVVTSFFVSFFLSSLLVAFTLDAEMPKVTATTKIRINFFMFFKLSINIGF